MKRGRASDSSEHSHLIHPPANNYVLYSRRWYILFIFSFLSVNQSNVWITYGAVLDTAKEMYNVSDGTINLIAAMGPAGFIPLSLFSSWLIGEKGLRVSAVGASFFVAAGAILRCFATADSFWIVILAQILNAAAGPVVMNSPPALSANWFGVEERTFATAIGSLSNFLGGAVGFLLGLAVTNLDDLRHLLFYEAIFSIALFILFLIYFPSLPPSPPSATAAIHRPSLSLSDSLRSIFYESASVFKSKDGVIMLMTSGLASGVYGGWSAMLVFILSPYYSQWDTQWLGLANVVAGVFGGVLVGKLHDKYYKHYKPIMSFFFLLSAGIFGTMSLATERIIICSFMEIMILNVACGFTINAIYPVAFEALIEITYPVKEEVSAGLISLMNNFACLALLIVGNYKTGNFINWIMTGVCFVCCLFMLITKETYKRSKIDLVDKSIA